MDENQNQPQNGNNNGGESKSSMGMIIGVVAAVAIIGLVALWFINRSSIDTLSRQLTETKDQVENVQNTSNEAKQNIGETVKEGVEDTLESIGDVNNPILRLVLAKAYVTRLSDTLDAAGKKDLNTIVVYVEKQPTVLIKPPATWPAEIQQAIANLKTKVANAKTAVAASVTDAKESVSEKVNDLNTLTGTLSFVSDDSVLGGSVFMMTTDAGRNYYFEFNEANSEKIKSTMLGKPVSIKVRVTGVENGHVTYDVVSGPTIVSATPTMNPTTSGSTSSGTESR